jgi:LCP family protein required for cell wall assembly
MERVAAGRFARVLVGITATLSLLVAAAGAIGIQTILRADTVGITCWNGGRPPCSPPPDTAEAPIGPCARDVCNYLIVGSDSRRGLTPEEQERFGTDKEIGGENRTDTIMVLHTDPDREKAVVLSFPRDLWVDVPDHGFQKINAAFEGGIRGGGPALMARTIHRLTGLEINHFLYVDLVGFQQIVDTLGGVELNVPTRLDDPLTDLHLRPGIQVLNGHDALAYVRTRALRCDETNPDFARIGRQQQFLRALINRMLQPSQLAQAPSLVHPILGNLRRDPDLKVADLAYLVGQLQGVDTGAVEFRAVPGSSKLIYPPEYPSGLAIVEMDPSAERLFAALRTGRALPSIGDQLEGQPQSPANIAVPVVDVGASTLAGDVLNTLSVSGFDISEGILPPEELNVPDKRSAIVAGPEDLVQAQVVQQYLPQLRIVENSGYAGVAVVVTADYQPADPAAGAPTAECIAV